MLRVLSLISQDFFDSVFSESAQAALVAFAQVEHNYFARLSEMTEEGFSALLPQHDVLLGGWGSRRLPDTYTPEREQLYCMTTGTVAAQMRPEHLERGLRLTNWGDSICQYIAESALMQILASTRSVGLHYERTHTEKSWLRSEDQAGTQSLFDRNVGLLGCGAIARKLIPLLRPFKVNIFAFDPYVNDTVMAELGVQRVESVRALFASVDIISNHLGKTAETNDLINAEMLACLPENGVVVNTARGNSLDEDALAAEHARGRLWSSLDVFKEEPLAEDSPLRDQPRCLIMCHQAGPTRDGYFKMGDRATENMRRFHAHETLIQELDAEKLRHMT